MAIGRAERRERRHAGVELRFGSGAAAVLDLLELVELAWHDCYGEVSPSEAIIDDILVASQAEWAKLISAAQLAVTDWRDLRIAADAQRRRSDPS
jgi:hypothetical protein